MNDAESQIDNETDYNSLSDLPDDIPDWVRHSPFDLVSSSDTQIAGSLDSINNSIRVLEKELFEATTAGANFARLNSELKDLKVKFAELELQKADQTASIKSLEEFFNKNLRFMTIATEANGRFNSLERQTDRIEKRLDQIEDKASKTKDRSIALWALLISILAIITSVLISIYT